MSRNFSEKDLTLALAGCLRQASCELPEDVENALRAAMKNEAAGSLALSILVTIVQNVELAKTQQQALCQDTGLPAFYVSYPQGLSTRRIAACIEHAVVVATEAGYLRPNAVDPVTGLNSGNNLGTRIPYTVFTESDEPEIRIDCLLKGGGSENVSVQYSLPDSRIDASRDLEGVRRCVLDSVIRAKGNGCAPGILGVGIGGDRITGLQTAKEQLFRRLTDTNPDPVLDDLERSLLERSNALGIGPMGLGGNTTLLGVKIGTAHRIPASFYVSVAYMCWACRRNSLRFPL